MSDTPYDEHFVSWFRAVTPYINAFRGKTFVIAFGGKAVASEFAKTLAYDVNLLVSLGIRLVLVHGARPQIEEELREKNLESLYHRGYRVTDAEALDCVLDAVGSVYLEIEAMLSQGLPNTGTCALIRVPPSVCSMASTCSTPARCARSIAKASTPSWDSATSCC